MLNCGVSSPSLNNQINSGVLEFCGLPEPNGMFGKKSVYRTDPHQTAPNQKKNHIVSIDREAFLI